MNYALILITYLLLLFVLLPIWFMKQAEIGAFPMAMSSKEIKTN